MTDQQPTKPKTSIVTALWWLASIAFCIWAVMALTNGNMPAMTGFLGAAIFAIPAVQAALRKLMDAGTPKWLVSLPAIGLFIAASVASGSAGSTATPGPTTKEEPVDVVANVVAFQGRYIGMSTGCKEAFQGIADEGQGPAPDIQQLYELAQRAEGQCRAARQVIADLDIPVGLSSEEAGAFRQAVLNCEAAYRQATDTASNLQQALDTRLQPSKVSEFRDSAAAAVAGRQSCEATVSAAVEAAVLAHRADPIEP